MNEFNEIVKPKTDEELLIMVYEFDKWDIKMLNAIENELRVRNILPTDVDAKKQELIEAEEIELLKGKECNFIGLIIGWLTVLGFWGLYVGYNYSYSKRRSKYTGRVYFEYDEESRNKGQILFYTAVLGLIIQVLYLVSRING